MQLASTHAVCPRRANSVIVTVVLWQCVLQYVEVALQYLL
jgi:hypothetical protein